MMRRHFLAAALAAAFLPALTRRIEIPAAPKPKVITEVGLTDWEGTEVSGNGYARQPYKSEGITFPQATGNWGTVAYVALFTADGGFEAIPLTQRHHIGMTDYVHLPVTPGIVEESGWYDSHYDEDLDA